MTIDDDDCAVDDALAFAKRGGLQFTSDASSTSVEGSSTTIDDDDDDCDDVDECDFDDDDARARR